MFEIHKILHSPSEQPFFLEVRKQPMKANTLKEHLDFGVVFDDEEFGVPTSHDGAQCIALGDSDDVTSKIYIIVETTFHITSL